MRQAYRQLLLLAVLTSFGCGDAPTEGETSEDWKADYAREHIHWEYNQLPAAEVASTTGQKWDFRIRFDIRNSGGRTFSGRFRGAFSLPGTGRSVPYLKSFTVEPHATTSVETFFRYTEIGVSSSCYGLEW